MEGFAAGGHGSFLLAGRVKGACRKPENLLGEAAGVGGEVRFQLT